MKTRVPKYVPQSAIRWLVGRFHVGVADSEIEADFRRRLAKNAAKDWTAEQTEECIKFALTCHHENQALYRAVMSGRF